MASRDHRSFDASVEEFYEVIAETDRLRQCHDDLVQRIAAAKEKGADA